jgi:hypothetical protein
MCSKIYKPELQSQHGQYQVSKAQASLSYGNTLSLYPELRKEKEKPLVRKIVELKTVERNKTKIFHV